MGTPDQGGMPEVTDREAGASGELRWWLALQHAPGLGCRGYNQLLEQFGSPRRLFREPALAETAGRPGAALRDYLRNPDWERVEQALHWLEHPGHRVITRADPAYPELLTQIADPPPLLYVVGDAHLLELPQLAIVGSRNPTGAGRRTAHEFARHLAGGGLCITSGLASGIDGASHQGALEARGHTIAVTGTGPDRIYPARHRELAHRIAEEGAIITEFPLGTPPLAANFPRRNRIISGLSLGTLVVEAATKSGSLITARLATEQGREAFAIPGSIHNPLARGCHALIRQGAKLVESADDILEELGPLLGRFLIPASEPQQQPPPEDREWDGEYRRLFAQLSFDPLQIDTLIQRSGLTPEQVSSMLLVLELEDYVSSAPGGRYQLLRSPPVFERNG